MLLKKGELKHLWLFYLCKLIEGLSTMILPFFVIYFLKLGYSYFDVSIIISSNGLAQLLFEIPTGIFADGYSRKYSVILGCLIIVVFTVLIPLCGNFFLVLLCFMLVGIGETFLSGAEEALVISNLNKEKRTDLHQEYFIKSGSFIALGSVFSPMLGALLVKNYSVKILWQIYGVGYFLVAVIFLFFVKEHFIAKKLKAIEFLKASVQNSKMSFVFLMRNKALFYSLIAGFFLIFMMSGLIAMQPFLVSLGMKEYQLGYLYSVTALFGICMSFGSRLFSNNKPKNVMSVVTFIVMLLLFSLILASPPYFLFAAVIFILKTGILSLGSPILNTFIHKAIPERIRATTVSTSNMMNQSIVIVSSIIAGLCLDFVEPKYVLVFCGLFGLMAIYYYQQIKD